MKRIKLTIAYDGTDFHGFQRQPGMRTVEETLAGALGLTTGEEVSLTGLSRTDAGVHALMNEVTFDTESSIPPEKYMYAALRYLPEDLRIVRGEEVPGDWDIRRQNVIKTYEYLIYIGRTEHPLMRRYSMYSDREPRIEPMRAAARSLIGEHDFTSFANPDSYVIKHSLDPVRKLTDVGISVHDRTALGEGGKLIVISVSANGFLYNMVRIIAGTLVRAGYGLIDPEDIPRILAARDRTLAGPTLEARGLILKSVRYLKNN